MTIQAWINRTTEQFNAYQIESAWLDVIILLENVSKKDRSWLLSHSELVLTDLLTIEQLEKLTEYVNRRTKREPIAYIVGYKEFYGLKFFVNNSVLIPRPESEDMISVIESLGPTAGKNLVDVGTGSGALAITAKLTHPRLIVTAVDISDEALEVAKQNAKRLKADIKFIKSNLLDEVKQKQDIIIANLPYVPPDYEVSPEISFEPARAIFTESGGLHLIEALAKECAEKLNHGGYVLLESLPSQMGQIQNITSKHDLTFIKRTGFIQLFRYWK